MKTTFSSGVIVTSQFLNGAQQLFFDGQDLDWHFPQLGVNSLITAGPNGLDSVYITLGTEQPALDNTGLYLSGSPITGGKVVAGPWQFGYDSSVVGNPLNIVAYAPRSFTTNNKYENANGIPSPSAAQKLAALSNADIVTKEVLVDQLNNVQDFQEIDNGVYYSATNPACFNYTAPGGSDIICPL